MTKLEFANAVAEKVNGVAKEVEKNNGVKYMGISKPSETISPCIYIDRFYDDGRSVEETVKEVSKIFDTQKPNFDMSFIYDYEKSKSHLKARLLNKSTSAEVFRSAEEYGFDDLIIVPYVVGFTDDSEYMTSAKISNQMIDCWKVDKEQVINDAIANSKNDCVCQSMASILFGAEDDDETVDQPMVITSPRKDYGAVGVLFHKELLKDRFPNGYVIVPSSVHEVIAFPYMPGVDVNGMISDINGSELKPEEVLGDHGYFFVNDLEAIA